MGNGHYRKNLDKKKIPVKKKTDETKKIYGLSGSTHPEVLRRAQIVEMTCLCGIKFKTTAGEKESGTRYCSECRKKKNQRDKFAIRQIHSGGVFDSEF